MGTTWRLTTALGVIALLAVSSRAEAQETGPAFGAEAGYLLGSHLDRDGGTRLGGAASLSASLDWRTGTAWSFRIEGLWAGTHLSGTEDIFDPETGASLSSGSDGAALWAALVGAKRSFEGDRLRPYAGADVGIAALEPAAGSVVGIVDEGGRQALHASTGLGVQVRGGLDYAAAADWTLQLEASDLLFGSDVRVYGIEGGESGDVGRIVHALRLAVGATYAFGQGDSSMRAPEPAPRPQPRPTLPVPTREISFCALDPGTGAGVSMRQGLVLVNSGDTLLVAGDRQVPLREAFAGVPTVGRADWYAAGRSLVIRAGQRTFSYAPYQGPRRVPAEALTYVGRASGVPVFVDGRELSGAGTSFRDVLQATPTIALDTLLSDDPQFRAAFAAVRVVYLPLAPAGCVFQPFAREAGAPPGGGAGPGEAPLPGSALAAPARFARPTASVLHSPASRSLQPEVPGTRAIANEPGG